MIRHLVMWKLDASYSTEEKADILKNFKDSLLQLEGKIEVLKSIAVNVNSKTASETNFDIVLDTTFNSIDALSAYQVHPEHIKVGAFVKSIKTQRACIDYEF